MEMLSEEIKSTTTIKMAGNRQKNIRIEGDGDAVNRDKITNVYNVRDTKLAKLFRKLKNEVDQDDRLYGICEELNRYLTDKDTIGLEKKLKDGGFDEDFILEAAEQKEYFSKKLYRYYEFESAQFIYVDLLALMKTNFQDYIKPLIDNNSDKSVIRIEVREKVINPIIELLRYDSTDDTTINLNAEEVKGMIYYLTGRCHIKWANDSI